jgi:hypothetical protein
MKKKMGKLNFDDGVEIHQTINFDDLVKSSESRHCEERSNEAIS